MNVSILTVFEQLYEPFLKTSLVRRAIENKAIEIDVESFFSFVSPKERIDAPTFGPGSGMLIRPEVVQKAVDAKEQEYGQAFKIFFSPQGEKLNQRTLQVLTKKVQKKEHVILLPARYEGMDARVEDYYADAIVSIGDFVLMGGDLPAMMLLEGMLRLIPGVVGKEESVREESFTGPFVDYPEYTEPVVWHGYQVPEVIRSGNHAAIKTWRTQQAAKKTVRNHFSWLQKQTMSQEQRLLAHNYIPSHYVALLHTDVLIGPKNIPGETSVTSIDIHAIPRSSKTYGVKSFFLVTPLIDQQKIVKKLLSFWQGDVGIEYNRNRHEAVKYAQINTSIDEVIREVEEKEGKRPLLIATSARTVTQSTQISFYDQTMIWKQEKPVLFIFGTGKGLTKELIARCDFVLVPIEGFTDFKHLSVRSAVAVVLDRWLGISPKEPKRLAE